MVAWIGSNYKSKGILLIEWNGLVLSTFYLIKCKSSIELMNVKGSRYIVCIGWTRFSIKKIIPFWRIKNTSSIELYISLFQSKNQDSIRCKFKALAIAHVLTRKYRYWIYFSIVLRTSNDLGRFLFCESVIFCLRRAFQI
jgi:hypothetical protein